MTLARWSIVALGVCIGSGAARAELVGGRETRCDVSVQLAGPIATVTESHDLIGTDAEAIYQLALPVGAAIAAARITPPGGRESKAVAISAATLATETPDATRLGIPPDLGLVRWRGSDGEAEHYELRATGLDAQRPLRVTVRWIAPAAYTDGRLVLRVPARGDGDELARCEVAVIAKAGGGVRSFGPAFVNGVKLASSGGRTAVASARALEIELVPVWIHDGPVAASASVPVVGDGGDSRTLTTVAVYLPPSRSQAQLAPRRLVLLVDTSRSLGTDGRAAVAAIADALIAAVLAVLDTSTATGATRADLARTAGLFTRTSPPGAKLDDATIAKAAAAGTELDANLPGSSYQVLIKYQLWPQLRACYQDALRGKPKFSGTLDLTLELARGEVHDVRIGGTPMPEGLIACAANAAYAMEVPSYPLDGLAEIIAVVHKPVYLRAPIDSDTEGALDEELGFSVAEPPPPPLR